MKIEVGPVERGLWPTLLLAVLLLVSGCERGPDGGGDEIDLARSAVADGEYTTAIIHLKNAIQKRPDRVEAHLELARIYDWLGDAAALRKQVERLRELGVSDGEVALLDARALLAERDYERLLAMEMPAAPPVTTALIHLARTRAAFALGDRERGRREFERALVLAPDEAAVLEMQARIAFRDGRREEAARLVDRALARFPEYPDLLDLKGQIALAERRYGDAVEAYDAILALPGADQALYGVNARFYRILTWIAAGEYDKARPEIEAMLSRAPRHPMPNYLMGLYAYRQGDFERAESHLLEVIKSGLDFKPAVLLLGAVDFAMGNYEQAEMYLSSYITRKPDNNAARKLLGITHLKLDDPHGALAVLNPLIDQEDGKNAGLLSLVGEIAIRAGDVKQAREYYRRALEAGARGDEVERKLAETYLLEGDVDRALELLEETMRGERVDERSSALLVMGMIREGRFDEAEELARQVLEKAPDAAFANNLLAGVLMVQKRHGEAEGLLRRALEAEEGYVPAILNLARLEEIRGKPESAITLYLKALEFEPDNARAMVHLARLRARSGSREQAIDLLERARRVDRSVFDARLMLAGLRLARGEFDAALEVAEEARQLRPGHPGPDAITGRILYRQGQYAEARKYLERWSKARPRQVAARLAFGEVLLRLEEREGARRELRAALDLDRDNLAVIRTLALAEVSWGNVEEARRLVEGVRSRFPRSVGALRIEGDVLWKAGRFAEAAQAYREALEIHPRSTLAIRVAKALIRGGEIEKAREELERWISLHPDDPLAHFELGNLLHQKGDLDGAIREFEAANALKPDSAAILNNLALVYFRQGSDKAVELAERAHRLAPDNPAIADTRGWILLHHGDVFQSLELLQQAAERLPGAAEIRYHLASALARAGQKAQARRLLEGVVREASEAPWKSEAEALLASLSDDG